MAIKEGHFCSKEVKEKCSCNGGQILCHLPYMTSQYEKNLWLTHVNIVGLAEPIRHCVHWRTQVFKIEGFVCKRVLLSPPLPSHLFPFLSLASFLAWSKPKLSFLALLCSETKRHCHCCFCSLSSIELWLQLDYLCQIFYIYFRSLLLYKRQTNSFHHYDSSTPFNTSAARSLAKNVEPFLLGKLGKRPDLFSVIKKWFFDTCILCRRNWGGGLENGKTT